MMILTLGQTFSSTEIDFVLTIGNFIDVQNVFSCMALLQKLFTRINGLHYRQEYLCLAQQSFQQPLYVYIVENGKIICDVTFSHSFVGYCPLIFALHSDALHDFPSETINLLFSVLPLQQNEFFNKKDAIASLVLKKIVQENINPEIISFYEGVNGTHNFLSAFHQSIIHLNNRIYSKKQGNVFLKRNLYNQVQIGYAIPRKISLVTVGENNLFNHFPTDLHGQINNKHYVISLRHEGKACKQVESAGRIILSDMNANAYKKVYALGKNHMQPLKERTAFDFSSNHSRNFHLPLPKEAVSYKELELVSSFIVGIHKLILFKIVQEETFDEKSTLVHIHNCYATWRNKQGIEGNYLLR
jgi:hypothetical protein